MPNITGQISRAQELTGNTSGNNRMSGQIQGVRGEKGDKGDKGDTGATGVGIASTTLNSDYTLTIVLTDGTSYTTPSIRGAQGQQGIQGDQGIQGVQGETGNGISSIAKTGTSGLVDTYTVTFTDGTTTTFTVTNGRNGTGSVADVWQNGVSVLDGNTAKVTVPTATSDLTNDSNFVEDANYVHTDNNYTSAEKSKLSGIASGAEVNVQSNWNETDSTADAYIKNKPTLATVATTGDYDDLSNKPDVATAELLFNESADYTDNAYFKHVQVMGWKMGNAAWLNIVVRTNEASSSPVALPAAFNLPTALRPTVEAYVTAGVRNRTVASTIVIATHGQFTIDSIEADKWYVANTSYITAT